MAFIRTHSLDFYVNENEFRCQTKEKKFACWFLLFAKSLYIFFDQSPISEWNSTIKVKVNILPWMDHMMLTMLYKLMFVCRQWNGNQSSCSFGQMFGLLELAAYWSMYCALVGWLFIVIWRWYQINMRTTLH